MFFTFKKKASNRCVFSTKILIKLDFFQLNNFTILCVKQCHLGICLCTNLLNFSSSRVNCHAFMLPSLWQPSLSRLTSHSPWHFNNIEIETKCNRVAPSLNVSCVVSQGITSLSFYTRQTNMKQSLLLQQHKPWLLHKRAHPFTHKKKCAFPNENIIFLFFNVIPGNHDHSKVNRNQSCQEF